MIKWFVTFRNNLLFLRAYTYSSKGYPGTGRNMNILLTLGLIILLILLIGGRNNNRVNMITTLTTLKAFSTGTQTGEFTSFRNREGGIYKISAEEISGEMTISLKKGTNSEVIVVINNGSYSGQIFAEEGSLSSSRAENNINISFSLVYRGRLQPEFPLRLLSSRHNFTFFNTVGVIPMDEELEAKIKENITTKLEQEIARQMQLLVKEEKPELFASP
jgi:hypothetical protein